MPENNKDIMRFAGWAGGVTAGLLIAFQIVSNVTGFAKTTATAVIDPQMIQIMRDQTAILGRQEATLASMLKVLEETKRLDENETVVLAELQRDLKTAMNRQVTNDELRAMEKRLTK